MLGLPGCAAVVIVPLMAGGAYVIDEEVLSATHDGGQEPVNQASSCASNDVVTAACPTGPVPGSVSAADPATVAARKGDEPAKKPTQTAGRAEPRPAQPAAMVALATPGQADRSDDGSAEPALDEHQPGDADDPEEAQDNASRGRDAHAGTPDEPQGISHVHMVRKGDTLMGILVAAGISREQAQTAVNAVRPSYDPRDLLPGQQVTVVYQPRPNQKRGSYDLYAFSVASRLDHGVTIVRHHDDRYVAREAARDSTGRMVRVRANFDPDSSLFEVGVRAGIPANLVLELIRIYSWDVDFERSVEPGDSLDVVFTNSAFAKAESDPGSEVVYSELTLAGVHYRLYRFEVEPGKFDYYNELGQSARKPLLRTPVQGAEFSSGFGRRRAGRYGFTRMHRGVDFRAPIGSPIYAAGDGVIASATFHRGYGYYVRIRHSNEYTTLYAHLQRPRQPLRAGAQIRQGEVIGHVGMTGRTTGPHLHYEVHLNGTAVDPLTVKLPSRHALAGNEMVAFREARDNLEREIDALPATTRFAGNERFAE
jgi:murein DD-endopeptidase MepM/ murein hydrolase activator NlpD